MRDGLLPIGTVVLLKESEGRLMISGYLPVMQSDPKHAYDYSGFRFPLGFVDNNEVYCFDQDQIDSVIQYGFEDYEGMEFLDELNRKIDDIKKEVAEG